MGAVGGGALKAELLGGEVEHSLQTREFGGLGGLVLYMQL